MPDGITALTSLRSLSLSAPFAPRRGLPPGFGALPLANLTLWQGDLSGAAATQELQGLTGLEVTVSAGRCLYIPVLGCCVDVTDIRCESCLLLLLPPTGSGHQRCIRHCGAAQLARPDACSC
jgi:hypothetical protein